MKKLFYFASLLLLFPAIVSAMVNHTRSFADSPVSPPLVVDIAVTDYDKDINCGGLAFWGIQAIEHETGNRFSGNPRFVSSEVLSQTFTLDLPLGDFEEMTFICSDNGENEAFQFGSIENDLLDDQIIFKVTDDVVLVVPEVLEVNATTTSITSDLSDGKTVTAPIDGVLFSGTTTDTEKTSSPITNTEEISADNSDVVIDAESQAAAVIVSDTNAESITSPVPEPEETVTETAPAPEAQSEVPSISADTNGEETITSEF